MSKRDSYDNSFCVIMVGIVFVTLSIFTINFFVNESYDRGARDGKTQMRSYRKGYMIIPLKGDYHLYREDREDGDGRSFTKEDRDYAERIINEIK